MKELIFQKVLILIKQINECMSCDYYYFKDVGFKYESYVCNACHDFLMIVQSLND